MCENDIKSTNYYNFHPGLSLSREVFFGRNAPLSQIITKHVNILTDIIKPVNNYKNKVFQGKLYKEIEVFNKEVAKAMIIDAARDWNEKPTPEKVALYGHGVVPIKIDDIIQTKDDEIKFLISDISEKWNTYNYSFPIPIKDDKYPYIARATMCYFPMCNRAQGVDYTSTELNLHFGRINNEGKIVDIKGDTQNQEETF